MAAPINVVLFGATGMVGQGALRESLLDPAVIRVVSVVRTASGQQHPKLREIVHRDFTNFAAIESDLSGLHACFWCLGVTSAGMSEEEYSKVTFEYTLAAARALVRLNSQMTFVFVSGTGADSSETGSVMWARVKGRAENALFALPFKAVYAIRPALIQPLHGITSRTAAYRIFYALTRPFLPLMMRLMPGYATTTEQLGRAMLALVRRGYSKRVLESSDLRVVAAS